ncbi:hypothetical protein N599_27020 [Saccharopolyspora erythraea D]|nr:hypothetical protein N599_27020 [Saccharopolyspora erythraea D]
MPVVPAGSRGGKRSPRAVVMMLLDQADPPVLSGVGTADVGV